jgi:hypothetical protein
LIANNLEWLEDFFQSLCNGDWEHGHGVRMETLDNPGWFIELDLSDTVFSDVLFDSKVLLRTDTDWIHCVKEEQMLRCAGGVRNLNEILGVIRDWVDSTGL